MTRTEAIAAITAKLASLDDGGVSTVADFIDGIATSQQPIRPLSPREMALVEQSKADFSAGRTYSQKESEAYVDAALAARRAGRAKV